MTKKLILAALLGLLALPAFAQTNVGVVDFNLVIQKSVKGKAFFEELDAFKQTKQGELDGKIAQLQDQQKDAQAKAASLTEEKKQEIAMQLQRMETDVRRYKEDAERETQLKAKAGLDRIQAELEPLVRQVALEKNLHLVMSYGAQSGIVFFNEKIDITNDVIKKYDESN